MATGYGTFTWQMDAILFCTFEGRWPHGSEFSISGAPERFAADETAQELAEV
jgi:hypothetical protein